MKVKSGDGSEIGSVFGDGALEVQSSLVKEVKLGLVFGMSLGLVLSVKSNFSQHLRFSSVLRNTHFQGTKVFLAQNSFCESK